MNKKVKDNISGALWLFTLAIFLILILTGHHLAWIAFIIMAGIQALIEAYYHSKTDVTKKSTDKKKAISPSKTD